MRFLPMIISIASLAFTAHNAYAEEISPLAVDGQLSYEKIVFPGKIHKVVYLEDKNSPVKIIDAKIFRPISEMFNSTPEHIKLLGWFPPADLEFCVTNQFLNASLMLDTEVSNIDFASLTLSLLIYDSSGVIEGHSYNLIANDAKSTHLQFPTGGPINRPTFNTMGGGILFVDSVIFKDGKIWESDYQNLTTVGLSDPVRYPIPLPQSLFSSPSDLSKCVYKIGEIN